MTNLVKYTKIIDKVLLVLWIIFLVAAGLAAISLVVGLFSAQPLADAIHKLTVDQIVVSNRMTTITFETSAVTASDFRNFFVTGLIMITIAVSLLSWGLWLLRAILAETQQGRPFSPAMTVNVRRVAYLLFTYAVVVPLIPMVPVWILLHQFSFPTIVSGQQMIGNGIQIAYQYGAQLFYNLNLAPVFAGLIVLLLSLVFAHGAELQRQSDETL